jgi:drug/metabolite transporter (DMT)-like permease
MASAAAKTSLKKTMAVLIPAVFAQASGNVFLSLKMKEMGGAHGAALFDWALESPTLWIGTALLIVSFILFAAALSWADLSLVVPAVSIEVVVNVIFADYFLHEVISVTRWTGVLLICAGIILVLRSERRKAGRQAEEVLRGADR